MSDAHAIDVVTGLVAAATDVESPIEYVDANSRARNT